MWPSKTAFYPVLMTLRDMYHNVTHYHLLLHYSPYLAIVEYYSLLIYALTHNSSLQPYYILVPIVS